MQKCKDINTDTSLGFWLEQLSKEAITKSKLLSKKFFIYVNTRPRCFKAVRYLEDEVSLEGIFRVNLEALFSFAMLYLNSIIDLLKREYKSFKKLNSILCFSKLLKIISLSNVNLY